MHDTAVHAALHIFLHNAQRILRRVPAVDHKGHFHLPGDIQLLPKGLLLEKMTLLFLVPVVIEPDLPHREDLRLRQN